MGYIYALATAAGGLILAYPTVITVAFGYGGYLAASSVQLDSRLIVHSLTPFARSS